MAIRGSIAPTLSRALRVALLTPIGGGSVGPNLGALILKLWKDSAFIPTPTNVAADFVAKESDFGGYASATPTFALANAAAPDGVCVVAVADFIATGTPLPQTIYGYWIESTTGSVVVAYEKFPAGLEVNIGNIGDFLSLTVEVPMDATQSA